MKPLMVGLGTLAVWVASVIDASAAWNNVYQPTLFGRTRQRATTSYFYTPPTVAYSAPVAVAAPTVAYSAPSACAPCQQQQCSTSYTQRCYYQPVTTMTTKSYYEPVTTYQTSYYYEPVTSYRYSCYYDPCTCETKQVATPVTSYSLRAKSCPVQSWVQRCAQVPVTTYQKACYLQPQTTCCTTTQGAPIPMGAGAPAPAYGSEAPVYGNGAPAHGNGAAPYGNGAPAYGNPPGVIAVPQQQLQQHQLPQQQLQHQSPQPPIIKENFAPSGPNVGNMSLSEQRRSAFPAAQPQWQAPVQQTPRGVVHPQVKLDRIVFGPESYVEGQIVRNDKTPRANANVLFVSADNGKRQNVTANTAGRFQVNLASGNYLVYVQNNDGTAQFHSRLSVQEQQTARITLVN